MFRVLKAMALAVALMVTVAPAHAGTSASDFTLRDIDNNEVQLSSFKGKVIILSFWATWCAPCKEEMPHLQRMYDKHKDEGFVVLSISADDARTASRVKPFIKSKGFSFPVVLDKDSSVSGVYNPSRTMPWTVVIDRNFEIAKVHSGYNPGDEDELGELVETLLAKGK